jgi:hypothetical protein
MYKVMSSATRLLSSAGLALSLGLLTMTPSTQSGAQSPPGLQSQPDPRPASHAPVPPLEVTSDTKEYCLRLLDRLTTLVRTNPAPAPDEVTELSTQGQLMCDHGQTKGGIMRLRRAWLLMTHPDLAAARQ